MLEALCLLCGSRKETVESTCVECGHSLREDEMELAHLFSSAHLSPDELEEASVRIARNPNTRFFPFIKSEMRR